MVWDKERRLIVFLFSSRFFFYNLVFFFTFIVWLFVFINQYVWYKRLGSLWIDAIQTLAKIAIIILLLLITFFVDFVRFTKLSTLIFFRLSDQLTYLSAQSIRYNCFQLSTQNPSIQKQFTAIMQKLALNVTTKIKQFLLFVPNLMGDKKSLQINGGTVWSRGRTCNSRFWARVPTWPLPRFLSR